MANNLHRSENLDTNRARRYEPGAQTVDVCGYERSNEATTLETQPWRRTPRQTLPGHQGGKRELLELKVRKPEIKPGLVPRAALLSRLHESDAQVISLIAPGGYGKSTVLTQFIEEVDAPVAWLTLDETDSDPGALIAAVEFALVDAALMSPNGRARAVPSGEVLTTGVRRLLGRLDAEARGMVVIDNVEQLSDQSATDVVGAIMAEATEHLRVVVGSRPNADLPIPLLRSRGSLLEVGSGDLAMSEGEIRQLFDNMDVTRDAIEAVLETTEGWPVGVYLSALAIQAGAAPPDGWAVRGDDVYISDYIRHELVKDIGSEIESFLLRSSVLTRMSADLCNYALEIDNSAETLQTLEASNLLIVPMDHNRTWYRYHNLLRDYLSAELHDRDSELEAGLNSRASDWFEANGLTELAIEHARLAGDDDDYVDLVKTSIRRFYAEGRMQTVARWLYHLEHSEKISDHPELAAIGALTRALDGDAGGAEQLARYVYRDSGGNPKAETELGPVSLLLRSYQAPIGAEQSLRDAQNSYSELQHLSEWTPGSLGAVALATVATDGLNVADPILADALWRGESVAAHPLSTAAKGIRAVTAIRAEDWVTAEELSASAIEEIELSGLSSYVTSCLPYVVAARVAAHRGDVDTAQTSLGLASAMRHRLTVAVPILSVLTLQEQASAYVEVADMAGARRVMRDAADIIAVRPRLGLLVAEHQQLKERLASLPSGSVGPSSLTKAEIRLLPFLSTHLSYPEIGERLYISRHTVKTHAMSIYRKLGVSSRSEAVEKAIEIGFIRR